jgi:hypothetical protein
MARARWCLLGRSSASFAWQSARDWRKMRPVTDRWAKRVRVANGSDQVDLTGPAHEEKKTVLIF